MHNLIKYLKKSLHYYSSPARINFDFGDISQAVFVVGSARSGTTWVTQLINADNVYRYIFEPFHPNQCIYMRDMTNTPYLRSGNENPVYEDIFKRVFSGQIHLKWTDKFNKKYFNTKRIVKSTRMMMSLKWVHEVYPAIPIVYILRHPLAVVSSRLKLASLQQDWLILNLNGLLAQEFLLEDYPECIRGVDISTEDEFQRQVLYWCIQNYIALDQLSHIPHKLLFYEDCLLKPIEAFWYTRRFITSGVLQGEEESNNSNGFAAYDNKQNQGLIRRIEGVSEFKFISTSGNTLKNRLSHWQKEVSKEQITFTNEMLHHFGLNRYYVAENYIPIESN